MLNKQEIVDLISLGKNLTEIAQMLDYPYPNLYYFIRKQGIEYLGRENNGKSASTLKARRKCRKIPDRDMLHDLYVTKRLSMGKIAKQLNTTSATVLAALKEFNIPSRLKNGLDEYKAPIHSKQTLESMYITKGLSMQEIADLLGYKSHGLVQQDLKYYGIASRTYKEAGKLLYEKRPEKRELHRTQFYDGTTGPKQNVPTWIERAFVQWASDNNLDIIHQFQIRKNWHRYDFRIDNTNILVEMDGVFWHSLPEHVVRDTKFVETANEHGFEVIRITDKELELYGFEIFDTMIKPHLTGAIICQSEVE